MTDPSHTEQAAQPGLREMHKRWAAWYLGLGTNIGATEDISWRAWKAATLAASPPETPVPQSEPVAYGCFNPETGALDHDLVGTLKDCEYWTGDDAIREPQHGWPIKPLYAAPPSSDGRAPKEQK